MARIYLVHEVNATSARTIFCAFIKPAIKSTIKKLPGNFLIFFKSNAWRKGFEINRHQWLVSHRDLLSSYYTICRVIISCKVSFYRFCMSSTFELFYDKSSHITNVQDAEGCLNRRQTTHALVVNNACFSSYIWEKKTQAEKWFHYYLTISMAIYFIIGTGRDFIVKKCMSWRKIYIFINGWPNGWLRLWFPKVTWVFKWDSFIIEVTEWDALIIAFKCLIYFTYILYICQQLFYKEFSYF